MVCFFFVSYFVRSLTGCGSQAPFFPILKVFDGVQVKFFPTEHIQASLYYALGSCWNRNISSTLKKLHVSFMLGHLSTRSRSPRTMSALGYLFTLLLGISTILSDKHGQSLCLRAWLPLHVCVCQCVCVLRVKPHLSRSLPPFPPCWAVTLLCHQRSNGVVEGRWGGEGNSLSAANAPHGLRPWAKLKCTSLSHTHTHLHYIFNCGPKQLGRGQ